MSNLETKSEKPKRTLNPIIKAMNDYRNNVIGEHIGSKAPKRTAPIFKVTLAAARSSLHMEESEKNTIGVVDKASELFSENPDKFVKLAEKLEKENVKSSDTEKKTKSKKEVVKEAGNSKKTKSKSKTEKVEEETSETVEIKSSKASPKKKTASPKKKTASPVAAKKVKEVVKPTVVDSDSASDDDSDSDSGSESD